MELPGLELIPGAGEPPFLGGGEHAGVDYPLVGRPGRVVAFDHFRADTFTADQLLFGAQQVREPMVQIPDLVQHLQLCGSVETEIADQGADVGPVLLFDVGAVVLVPRPRPGEGDLIGLAVLQQMGVDELRAIEFLTVVNQLLGVHAGVGAGEVSDVLRLLS